MPNPIKSLFLSEESEVPVKDRQCCQGQVVLLILGHGRLQFYEVKKCCIEKELSEIIPMVFVRIKLDLIQIFDLLLQFFQMIPCKVGKQKFPQNFHYIAL